MESSPALAQLGLEINKVNQANGWDIPAPADWNDENRIPTFLALIHSEVSEALEGFRHNDRENFNEELADVLIRVLDLATGLGIDIDHEVAQKMEKNRCRQHRHGWKRI
jgi:NTP pyrophosphatase (non-canonical NTP hydrolase)